jgi:hypothetical protein
MSLPMPPAAAPAASSYTPDSVAPPKPASRQLGAGAPSAGPPSPYWRERLFADNAGLAVTLGYLVLTAVGMLHTAWVFLYFRINILDFAEPSDFLLAFLRDPVVSVMTVLPAVLSWLYIRGSQRFAKGLGKRSVRARAMSIRWIRIVGAQRYWRIVFWMRVVMVVLWAAAFQMHYSRVVALKIRSGEGKRVEVQLVSPPPAGARAALAASEPPILLGATGQYVFLYSPERKATDIVPVGNIARLTVSRYRVGRVDVRPVAAPAR